MRIQKLLVGLMVAVLFLSFDQAHKDVMELETGQSAIFYLVTDMNGRLTADSNLQSADEMVSFIRFHKNWVFELRCHTDSRGSGEFNLRKSKFVAKNLRLDLSMSFDIDESRLIPIGCGEENLIIPDSVISLMASIEMKELAHGINRRFELKAVRLFENE
jgi:hypothetical protein